MRVRQFCGFSCGVVAPTTLRVPLSSPSLAMLAALLSAMFSVVDGTAWSWSWSWTAVHGSSGDDVAKALEAGHVRAGRALQ